MAQFIHLEVAGLDDMMRDVRQAGGDATKLTQSAIVNSTLRVQKNIRERAPHRTGTLQRGVLAETRGQSGVVSVTEKYGEYIEEGTGIYGPTGAPITPKTGKALKLMIGGVAIFRRSVKGMKARPFFRPGFEASKDYIDKQFTRVLDKLTKQLAGK